MEFREKAIATVIRRLRKNRRLSQEVLSGLAGMERSHLGMVEFPTSTLSGALPTRWI